MKTLKLLSILFVSSVLLSCTSDSYEDYRTKATLLKTEIGHLKFENAAICDTIDAMVERGEKGARLDSLKARYEVLDKQTMAKTQEFRDLLKEADGKFWWRARIYTEDR